MKPFLGKLVTLLALVPRDTWRVSHFYRPGGADGDRNESTAIFAWGRKLDLPPTFTRNRRIASIRRNDVVVVGRAYQHPEGRGGGEGEGRLSRFEI